MNESCHEKERETERERRDLNDRQLATRSNPTRIHGKNDSLILDNLNQTILLFLTLSFSLSLPLSLSHSLQLNKKLATKIYR